MMPRRKNLGSVAWTARRRDGTPYLIVRWARVPGSLQVMDTFGYTISVAPRDVRRLMRLMQQALDWRYGKRKEKQA